MSYMLLEFTKSYAEGRVKPETFSEAYIELYRLERDHNLLLKDNDKLSECLSSIFCIADLYNPESDKEEYELNDEDLLIQVNVELDKLND
ncbi:colicin immunity domain-containing protein [Providencia rettgeri]|uniref:Colicin immunity protein n=1 Tax=Providencia rettgeri TaxID=587 RepID=A0AAD2VV91_PRORE|nr:colicin immunity domain-containing protein [Providencia rettgeri]ELR5219056.1 colicin immunity protein [Providencia rettgeri]ELR5222798.1 colicin immunity protein [Providencia rettgeri]MDX7322858.1 colicin immunity domain-containing protein [Providencia rettgeri]